MLGALVCNARKSQARGGGGNYDEREGFLGFIKRWWYGDW